MLSTTVVLTLVLFIASCFAVEVISKDALLRSLPETKEIIDRHFYSVDISMLSFLQFVTMDSISAMYFPLIQQRGYLFVFFFALILVVSISLVNIITANLLEVAISNSTKDKEMQEESMRQLRPEIVAVFEEMDENGDKLLTREEVLKCKDSLPSVLAKRWPDGRLVELFDMLDIDSSGSIDMDEFIDGVLQLAGDGTSFTTLRLLKGVTQIKIGQQRQMNELLSLQSKFKRFEKTYLKK